MEEPGPLILQLLLHLGNYLLDTGWVNTTVSNQLMERNRLVLLEALTVAVLSRF